jgi:hypothetical protein
MVPVYGPIGLFEITHLLPPNSVLQHPNHVGVGVVDGYVDW